MIKFILYICLLVATLMTVKAQATTQFIKYKEYVIPIQASPYRECMDGRPRVIVASDINQIGRSDPDDIQSMVHLLASSNQFETLGLISTPGFSPSTGSEKNHILNIVNAYALDYSSSNPASLAALGYPQPSDLSQTIRQGLFRTTNIVDTVFNVTNSSHQGAKLILDEAQRVLDGTECGPVYVLVWGTIPDLALALKESERLGLGIERVLRVYFIANVNKTAGQPGYNYIFDNFLVSDRLWFIQSEQTFRGANSMGFGGPTRSVQQAFLDSVKNRGCLGYTLDRAGQRLDFVESKPVKIGDTPSLLYVMNGDSGDPTSPSWGGQYKQVPGYSKWWVDGHVDNVFAIKTITTIGINTAQQFLDGSTVGQNIPSIYSDWQASMNRFSASLPSQCIATVSPTVN